MNPTHCEFTMLWVDSTPHIVGAPPLLPALAPKCGYNQLHHLNPPHILSQEITRYTVPGRIQIWEGGLSKRQKNGKKPTKRVETGCIKIPMQQCCKPDLFL